MSAGLMTLVPLKGLFGSGALRWTASIVSGYTYRSQLDTVAASGTVITIMLQSDEGYARLGAALGTGNKCFTSCHTRLSFLSRTMPQSEKASNSDTYSRIPPIFSCCVRNFGLDYKSPWYDV
jgi:hypothetical protein